MYPRYEQYQDSGVAWLGEVPSHWEVKRLKFAIHYISDKTEVNFLICAILAWKISNHLQENY